MEKNMSKLNAAWHLAHPMPKNPTIDQRIVWHLEHKANCGCRDIPAKIKDAIIKTSKKIIHE